MEIIAKIIKWLFAGTGVGLLTFVWYLINQHEAFPMIGKMSISRSFGLARKIILHLKKTNYLGKGPPELIVGISAGGSMFADFISKNSKIPAISLFADVWKSPRAPLSQPDNMINVQLIPLLRNYKKFLIIQDIIRTGRTIEDIQKYFRDNVPNCTIQIVTLVVCTRANPKPDYYGKEVKNIDYKMPYTINE